MSDTGIMKSTIECCILVPFCLLLQGNLASLASVRAAVHRVERLVNWIKTVIVKAVMSHAQLNICFMREQKYYLNRPGTHIPYSYRQSVKKNFLAGRTNNTILSKARVPASHTCGQNSGSIGPLWYQVHWVN